MRLLLTFLLCLPALAGPGFFMNQQGVVGASSTAFSPTNISGLSLWLVADDIAGSDGDAVATWTSRSGPNATQGTAANRPTLQTAEVNGHSAVLFDGVNDFLSGTVLSVNAASTIYIVYKPATLSRDQLLFQNGSANGWLLYIDSTNVRNWAKRGSTAYATSGTASAAWAVESHIYDGSNLNGWIDGSSVQSVSGVSAPASPTTSYQIGALDTTGFTIWFSGYVAEVLVYSEAISAGNRALLDAYYADKY